MTDLSPAKAVLASGEVERWHTKATRFSQTNGAHAWEVTQIMRFLYALYEESRKQRKLSRLPYTVLVEHCLDHDMPEFLTGDVSGAAKQKYPDLKKILDHLDDDFWERYIGGLYCTEGKLELQLSDEEYALFKIADNLSALRFAKREVRCGNDELFGRVAESIERALPNSSLPWLVELFNENCSL